MTDVLTRPAARDEFELGRPRKGNHPWEIRVVKHPERSESSHFRAAKKTAKKILEELEADGGELPYGPGPWEMHHGGSLWVRAESGWRMYRARVGIEWSAQFCADPVKVDRLRREAAELIEAFPLTLPALDALGYKRARDLLDTPITDADGVEAWTDSLFNACVPLSTANHSGVLPKAAGEHHYPWPVKAADYFRYDDFELWVRLPDGTNAAVTPVDRRGSGEGAVRIVHARHGTPAGDALAEAQRRRMMAVVPPDSPIALAAFEQQIPRGSKTASVPLRTRRRRSSDGARRSTPS
ncbi:hypothetical protein J7F01_17515 [Streptomyces sp. ISL-22]|uniref:Uncharacterized protein n=1 Tax=Streptomyces curacoi TaxID=146536 RepID=A0A117PK76_9ACTN|nr:MULTISPECIES: DUF6424 family protein [Streptomyces]KUM81148.1 hypothetical protein AQI70_03925 [Streptomyces curacoi]MBT2420072.1 hypothetical protein [Streptomyces sp. ISL-24]MBT2433946.1 hypothetical protein [Streptomyces sp. ISL-22]